MGWALDTVVELDCHLAGFAGSYLRSSDERRQVVAAYMAVKLIGGGAAATRDIAGFLTRADHRTILQSAFGDVPRGLRGALRRSGSQPHEIGFYAALNELLSSPPHAGIGRSIAVLTEINPLKLSVARKLPAEVCVANVIDAVKSVKAADDTAKVIELLIANGVDRAALIGAVRSVGSSRGLSELWRRWTRRTVFDRHPVPASPDYAPVRNAGELRRLARRYRNCAEHYIPSVLDGFDHFAQFDSGGQACVVHVKRRGGVWYLEDLFGKHNARPHPALRAAATAYLREHGVSPWPSTKAETGEWAVLHRLSSSGRYDFEEDD